MRSDRKYYFFRCYHCGEWHYGNRIIKSRKCWKCDRIFQFKNSIKFSRECSINEAITVIKQLKEREQKPSISKYVINHYNMSQRDKI